jgi:hypothetical protein
MLKQNSNILEKLEKIFKKKQASLALSCRMVGCKY